MPGSVRLDEGAAIARVLIAQPGKRNAMSRAMWHQLRQAFLQVQAGDWRCVIVAGEGDAFCAGGDIAEYPAFRFDEAQLQHFHEVEVWGALQAMLACDVPIVAAIQGACMGAGLEIASCCDIRLAADSARFGAPIGRLGFPMAPPEAQLVAAAAGEATARELLLEAAVLPAAEMHRRGFLHDVVPESALADRAAASAQRIAALAPRAARLNKRTLRALHRGEPLDDAYRYAASPEHREGIGAFLDKRKPAF